MTLRRKIRYQTDYYKRVMISIARGFIVPEWFSTLAPRVICIVVLVVFSLAYIWQVTSAAGSGYEMRDLQTKVENLRADIQKLDVNLASNNALTNLRKRVQMIQMAPIANIIYIESGATVVAKR
jgi:hypothetical protein